MKKLNCAIILSLILSAGGILWAEPHAYPVPFVAKDHNDISFRDLPGPGSIKIYTISGEEVIKLSVSQGEIIKDWDVRNTSGNKVATGVYLFLIEAGGTKSTGKLVVIR